MNNNESHYQRKLKEANREIEELLRREEQYRDTISKQAFTIYQISKIKKLKS